MIVDPFCRKGFSPQGEPAREASEEIKPILIALRHTGRGMPRSPARQAGPTNAASEDGVSCDPVVQP